MLRDVRFALRSFRRRPGVVGLVVLTLAVGLAASTTIFSIADAILWHPLPFHDAERLVSLRGFVPVQPDQPTLRLATFDAWTALRQVLSECYPYTLDAGDVSAGAEPEAVTIAHLSPGLITSLGKAPIVGRDFTSADIETGAPVAIVRAALWRRLRQPDDGSPPQIAVNGVKHSVVGVMADSFEFPVARVALWLALPAATDSMARAQALGRLRAGLSLEAAQVLTIATTGALKDANGGRLPAVRLVPFVTVFQSTSTALHVLLLGVALLLLTAIANAANLLLAESVGRDGEMALRAALGAGWWMLGRQILTETLLLAGAAGTLALAMSWSIRAPVVRSLSYLMSFQALRPIDLDWRALAFATAMAAVAGCAVGLAALVRATRLDLHASLVGLSRHAARRSFPRALTIGQLAVTLVLLSTAGLLANSFARLSRLDPGFEPEHLVKLGIQLPSWRFGDHASTSLLLDRIRAEATALPGVVSATLSEGIPPHLSYAASAFETADHGDAGTRDQPVATTDADVTYFATLGIPLLAGRPFGPEDAVGTPRTALISRALADLLWPRESPLGRQFRIDSNQPWLTVAGVVGNVRNGGFDNPLGQLAVYTSRSQQDVRLAYASLVVRTAPVPELLVPALRALVRRLAPDAPIAGVETAYETIGASNARVRFVTFLMAGLAGTALLLALIGVYGAFWYAVRQRSHEIGVRSALGATPGDIVRMVLGSAAKLAAMGLVIGLPVALATSRMLQGLLFEVSPADPAMLGGAGAALVVAALGAAFGPAWHASQIDPLAALRHE